MDSKQNRVVTQIEKYKQTLIDGVSEISLTDILTSEACQQILSECREFRDRIYTPIKTIFTFIRQVLNPDKSCKKAVSDIVAERLALNEKRISSNTGPYCKARKRIPEGTVQDLVKETGQMTSKKSLMQWRAYGRELKVFDGSTAKMSDTVANQSEYPQVNNQKKGIGFPIIRFVVVMSLTVGTVLDYAMGAYSGKGTGESSLLRSIFNCIKKKRYCFGRSILPKFFLLCDLKHIGADGIFRGQAQRYYDFRSGVKLGKNDHVANWKKPSKPAWMDQEQYDAYPTEIQAREFKVNGNVYVTTFLNAKKYHKQELAKIYERRWDVEINLKSIKEIMNMDFLSCKTPEMVRKEMGIHFLAYNFIRIIMAEACEKHNAIPSTISFKGSVQQINSFTPYFLNSNEEKNKMLYAEMLSLIVQNKIGNRPGRVEPRAVKRRPKAFSSLSRPRSIEKKRLMRKIEKMILKNASA